MTTKLRYLPFKSRFLSRSCSNMGSEEWKYNSNFEKDFWNRQIFGPIKRKRGTRRKNSTEVSNSVHHSESFWMENLLAHKKSNQSETKAFDYRSVISEAAANVSKQSAEPLSPPSETKKVSSTIPSGSIPNPLKNPNKKLKTPPPITMSFKRDDPNIFTHCVSVSKVLKETMPVERKISLQKWEEKMIAEMGKEKFLKMQENILVRGKRLHNSIETFFKTGNLITEDDLDAVSANHIQSLSSVIDRFERPVLSLESQVVHPTLNYHGYMDCVAKFSDNGKSRLALVDWKTSQKEKATLSQTFDTPIQIAAYAGALNHDERYPFQVSEGLAVIIYSNGFSAKILPITSRQLQYYWGQWLLRLKAYREMENIGNFQTVQL